MTKTCGGCGSFQPDASKTKGACFLQPPTPMVVGMQADPLGRPQPVTVSLRPLVGIGERACAMWQPGAAPPPDPRHPGSDTFNGRLVTDPVERAAPHRPVKVTGEWHCADCQATGGALDTTPCPGKPADAETSE